MSSELTRRQFCVITGAGVAVTACGSSDHMTTGDDMAAPVLDLTAPGPDLSTDPNCPPGSNLVNAGPAATLDVGKLRFFSCPKVFVLRDVLGIYAMTAVCTHMGCTVAYMAMSHDFACPCHMSTYDLNGNVTNPPAMIALKHFACSLDGSDNIIVDLSATVAETTRLTIQD